MKFILIIIALILLLVIIKIVRRKPNDSNNIILDKKASFNSSLPIQELPVKEKSGKTWGKFDVVGYHHLPEEVKNIVWKELKVGDELFLIPDPNNPYDSNAIKVIFKDSHIGWFPKDHRRKKEIFDSLISNKEVKVLCTENRRKGDTIRASRPDSSGKWNDNYRGMAQFVECKFEYYK